MVKSYDKISILVLGSGVSSFARRSAPEAAHFSDTTAIYQCLSHDPSCTEYWRGIWPAAGTNDTAGDNFADSGNSGLMVLPQNPFTKMAAAAVGIIFRRGGGKSAGPVISWFGD